METIKSSNTNGAWVSYTYDNIYRGPHGQVFVRGVVYRLNNEAVTLDPNSVDGSVAYTLDPVGNRSSDTSSLSGVTPGSWTYNANDEQVSTETYDPNGNTLITGGNTFTYDSPNRMTAMPQNRVFTPGFHAFQALFA